MWIITDGVSGVTTQGETRAEAEANFKEALELYQESFGYTALSQEAFAHIWEEPEEDAAWEDLCLPST